jgi:hypothetical protein
VIVLHGTAAGAFVPVAQLSAVIAAAVLTVMLVPLPCCAMAQAEASASISAQAVALTGIDSAIER